MSFALPKGPCDKASLMRSCSNSSSRRAKGSVDHSHADLNLGLQPDALPEF